MSFSLARDGTYMWCSQGSDIVLLNVFCPSQQIASKINFPVHFNSSNTHAVQESGEYTQEEQT